MARNSVSPDDATPRPGRMTPPQTLRSVGTLRRVILRTIRTGFRTENYAKKLKNFGGRNRARWRGIPSRPTTPVKVVPTSYAFSVVVSYSRSTLALYADFACTFPMCIFLHRSTGLTTRGNCGNRARWGPRVCRCFRVKVYELPPCRVQKIDIIANATRKLGSRSEFCSIASVEIQLRMRRARENDHVPLYVRSIKRTFCNFPKKGARPYRMHTFEQFSAICDASPCIDDPQRWWAKCGPSH